MNQAKFKKYKKAVFFDRDGVINKDIGYLHKKEDFEWIDGAVEAISLLKKKKYLVIVVSNQSGVERGYYKIEDVNKLHTWINNELKRFKTCIDDFFFSTELPSNSSVRRKPSPQMLIEAIEKYDLDREKCFMVGDKNSDIKCAKNAKIKGFLFEGKNLLDKIEEILKELKIS